jgi:hypothetical protein
MSNQLCVFSGSHCESEGYSVASLSLLSWVQLQRSTMQLNPWVSQVAACETRVNPNPAWLPSYTGVWLSPYTPLHLQSAGTIHIALCCTTPCCADLCHAVPCCAVLQGWASTSLPPLDGPPPSAGMQPLLDVLLGHVPPPEVSTDTPFSMCVAMIERDPFVGRIATGREGGGVEERGREGGGGGVEEGYWWGEAGQ